MTAHPCLPEARKRRGTPRFARGDKKEGGLGVTAGAYAKTFLKQPSCLLDETPRYLKIKMYAEVAEQEDAVDSKSTGVCAPCGFDSRPRHFLL